MNTTTAETVQPFNIETDRCDRCGARAYSRAIHDLFGELLFCGHHTNASAETLTAAGWKIQVPSL